MQNKRGQFYLIAAVIIISLVIGFAVLRNVAKEEKETTKVYDIREEFEIETSYVYDYGIFTDDPTNFIDTWLTAYTDYAQTQEAEEWVIIYGTSEDLTRVDLSRTEPIGSEILETSVVTRELKSDESKLISQIDGEVTVQTGEDNEDEYKFDLKEGENFYIIVKSGEYVSRSAS